jgi:subtilisin family serine protease
MLMKKSLIFIMALTTALAKAAEPEALSASLNFPVGADGYLLQTTRPGGQSVRWYRQANPKYLVELSGPALYPALRHQALQQLNPQVAMLDSVAQQQLLAKTSQRLALNTALISSLRQQIEQEQQQVIAAVQQISGAQVEQQFSQLSNLLLVSGPLTQAQLAAIPGVVRVWPEQAYQVALSSSVPKIKAPDVWSKKDSQDRSVTGQGVRIAVLDTGIDFTHPALGGCLGDDCKVIRARNTIDNNDDVTDVHGHGTHVAAIAAGKADTGSGVAPEAKLLAVKVLNDQGYAFDSSVIAGIEYAVDPDGDPATDDGADIINMSLGGPGDAQSPISQAAEKAVQAGVAVVVAAGNNWDYLSIGSPAAAPSVITVANTERDDRVSFTSSRGPLEGATYLKPEIAAPGTDIEAARSGGGLKRLSGTSMAAPHVAGAAALLLQAQPQLTPLQLKQRLVQSADLINANPAETGGGRLNVLTASTQTYFLQETALYLGRVSNQPSDFSGSRQVTFYNPTAQSVTVTASVLKQFDAGLKVSFAQTSQQVAAQSSAIFTLNFSGQSNDIAFPDNDGGVSGFTLAFDTAGQRLTLPVWYEKYQSLEVQTDGALLELRFLDDKMTERFYSSNFKFGVHENKQLRIGKTAQLKQVYARFFLPDPKNSLSGYVNGFTLSAMPELNNAEAQLDMRSETLTEYHQISDVKMHGQSVDIKGTTLTGSMALLKNQQVVSSVLYSMRFCSLSCELRPDAFMTGGFNAPDWQFEQTFLFPNYSETAPETWFFSWQKPLGLGSTQTTIDFTENSLLKFNLIPGKTPVTGGGLTTVWPFAAKAGDVMRVYQSGPLLLPETAPQIQSYKETFVSDSHSGFFSASDAGSIVKWRISETGPAVLVKAVDFNTQQLPLTSSIKAFSGAIAVSQDRARLQLSQAPRNNAEGYHEPVIWHDQYLNAAYFNRDTDIQFVCEFSGSQRWGDRVFGVWTMQSKACREMTLQVDSTEAKLMRHAPVLHYAFSKDGAMPRLTSLALFNRQQLGETVSRIDHKLNFDIWNPDSQSPISQVEVDFRTDSGNWRTIYQKLNSSSHSVRLPISAETLTADLRIKVVQANGNSMTQVIPEALTIGASAGGDNDVDSDGILNTVDADNDNDGVADADDALPFDPNEVTDTDKDGIGNNADPDDDNDGAPDVNDAFPLDPKESLDTDKDGIGNNADPDDDNDGVADGSDAFPLDPKESVDSDKDGIGNNADPDDDNDGTPDVSDAFPLDPKESLDTDNDGIGNNADPDDDNDGVTDTADAFPLDPKESVDTDKDGIGNNADPDDDNDGVADSSDKYPLDATRSSDPVTPDAGSSGSGGGGGAGLGVLLFALPLLAWRRQRKLPHNKAA